jgi:Tfp pilus assembly protein PilE
MKINQRGYTVVELIVVLLGIGWVAFCIWLLSLIVRVILKYLNS